MNNPLFTQAMDTAASDWEAFQRYSNQYSTMSQPIEPTDADFPKFEEFPPEIRLMVWKNAYLDSEIPKNPGVCVFARPEPPKHGLPAMDPSLPCVDMRAHHLISVCPESRAVVLEAEPGTRFRWSADENCNIACREFEPDLDTAYISHSTFDVAMAQAGFFGGLEAQIQRVALDACLIVGRNDHKLFNQVIPRFPAMDEIKLVLMSEDLGVHAQAPFPLPTKPFKIINAVPNGKNGTARELERWVTHLSVKAIQLGFGPAAVGGAPAAAPLGQAAPNPAPAAPAAAPAAPTGPAATAGPAVPAVLVGPAGLAGPVAPLGRHAFELCVFAVPLREQDGQKMWGRYPERKKRPACRGTLYHPGPRA